MLLHHATHHSLHFHHLYGARCSLTYRYLPHDIGAQMDFARLLERHRQFTRACLTGVASSLISHDINVRCDFRYSSNLKPGASDQAISIIHRNHWCDR
jgi:hypothetical protein